MKKKKIGIPYIIIFICVALEPVAVFVCVSLPNKSCEIRYITGKIRIWLPKKGILIRDPSGNKHGTSEFKVVVKEVIHSNKNRKLYQQR